MDLSARELAKLKTREELLLAGIEEFAEHGLDIPSLDAICARAGRTRGAFYVHFADREDFIAAVMERVFKTFVDTILRPEGDDGDLSTAVERFIGLIGAATEPDSAFDASSKQLSRILEACSRSERAREQFARMIESSIAVVAVGAQREQQAQVFREDVEAQDLGALLTAVAIGAIVATETGVRFDPSHVGRALMALLRKD